MGERYWNSGDAQWPEGHEFDQRRGRFDALEESARAGPPREPGPANRRRLARAYMRSDARILDDVCERLAHSNAVDLTEVSVEVHDGRVTLEGTVPHRSMRYALEDIAAQCLGVIEVDNRVRVAQRDRTIGPAAS